MLHTHARTAILAVLLVATGIINPYLGIHQAHATSEFYGDVKADVVVTEYDFLPNDTKAELDESYAQMTDSIEKIASLQFETRPAVLEVEEAESEGNELDEIKPTPTPTHFTQIASTSIQTSEVLGTEEAITPIPTEIPAISPVTSAPADIQALIEAYAPQYGADPAKMAVIAKCESGFRPDAVSPSGAYVGLFQFVSGTWVSNRNAMGLDPNPALRANAEEAIKTAAFKMGRDGYGAWPVCGKI